MKRCTLLLLFGLFPGYAIAQLSSPPLPLDAYLFREPGFRKPPLDINTVAQWPAVTSPAISNDGKFVKYTMQHYPAGANTLVIKSTDNDWSKELALPSGNTDPGFFDEHSRHFIFLGNDTMYQIALGSGRTDIIPGVASYKWHTDSGRTWVAYQPKNTQDLVVRNLLTGKEQRFAAVLDYSFGGQGKVLVLTTRNGGALHINWVDLPSGKARVIWSAAADPEQLTISNQVFDENNEQLAFQVQVQKGSAQVNSIWCYKKGAETAMPLVSDGSPQLPAKLSIDASGLSFSDNAGAIIFTLKQVDHRKARPDAASVEVWYYKEPSLQTYRPDPFLSFDPALFKAAINLSGDHQVTRLEYEDERMMASEDKRFVIVHDKRQTSLPALNPWWDSLGIKEYYLVAVNGGERKLITKGMIDNPTISPLEKYVVYYDPSKAGYFSYNISTGKTVNISQSIPVKLTDGSYNYPGPPTAGGVAGWMADDAFILLYDRYDIWQVDPSGIKPPVNITNGYGRLHHIKLKLLAPDGMLSRQALKRNDTLLLTAFNTVSKYNGFCRTRLSGSNDPEPLIMGPYDFFHSSTQVGSAEDLSASMCPLKARDANKWIVQRMSVTEAPNYYITSDLKTYVPVSDLQPQQSYNWLTAELVDWQQPDGTSAKGILYKPENFDAAKKYPVIFHYYEHKTSTLHQYPTPELCEGPLNIAWFVSRGYLVFTPDINFVIGAPGESAYNTVVSAAKHLGKLPYVDAGHMGLQGHSFGGYETNYIVTHTGMFAAACSAAGYCDLISWYGADARADYTKFHFELDQGRMGGTPWEIQDQYLKNSPILCADQLTTPLLLLHNQNDNIVYFSQSTEFFTCLRRLGKKVWLLQYTDGYHTVSGKDAEDYTVRLTQFFDHYLKGAPAPKWMEQGIPPRLKGIELGYELESTGKNELTN